MVEHALWEGSSGCELSQMLSESERLSDWQVTLDNHQWGSIDWFFSNNDSSSLGKALIDTSHSIIWGLDFAEEDRFLESGHGGKKRCIEDSSGSGNDLSTTSVDSISMEGDV